MTFGPRSRVSDSVSLTSRPDTRSLSYVGASSTSAVSYRSPVGVYRSVDDVVTQNFLGKQQAGVIVNNPFSSYRSVVSASDKGAEITKSTTVNGDWYKETYTALSAIVCNPPVGSYRIPTGIIDAAPLDTLAFTAAVSKMGAPDIQSLVSIGEIRQTLNLLTDPYKIVKQWLRNPKAPKGAFNSEAFANYWLTYRYGIIPAISDIQGLLKALSRKVSNDRFTARALETESSTAASEFGYADARMNLHSTCTKNEQYQVSAGVLYEAQLTLSDRLGVTPTNIASTMWELLPWSFVYDWLINVGDVIAALEAALRCKTLCAWTSSTRWCQWYYECDSFTLTSNASSVGWSITKSCVGGKAVGDYRFKTRRPMVVSDIGLVAKLRLTPKRVADAIALGRTNLRVK